jgi:hypothetical protein
MALAGYYYTVDVYATELYTEEPNQGTGFPNTYYKLTTSKSISTDQKLVYRVTIFKDDTGTDYPVLDNGKLGSSPQQTIPSVTGSRLPGDGAFATWKTKAASVVDSISSIRTINDRYYDFTVTSKKGGNVTPVVKPQVRYNGIWQDVDIKSGTKIPTITFTKKATSPAKGIPDTVKAHDYLDNLGQALPGSQQGPYEWNSCKKYWVRYWRESIKYEPGGADSLKNPAYYTYKVQVKYFDDNGDPVTPKTTNYNNPKRKDGREETRNGGFYAKGSASQQALKVLNDAKMCASAGSGGGGTPPTVTPTPESVKKADNFNPYPHIATRHQAARVFDPKAGGAGLFEENNVYDQLASFYIDPDQVDLGTGKAPNKDKYSKAADVNRFWGFRFLFNPQYISYSMNANSQVDWTRPNDNGALLVAPGIGGYITLNILIDRVADMNTMREWYKSSKGATLKRGPYPVDMDPEQCAGILYRGTEYDLEYLFRVLNGNPQSSTLLGSNPGNSLEMLTANLGYIAQLPFVFKVQDHMRYKVILSSLSIEHSMFTKEMIPIRSVVQIQLERIPDVATKGSKYLKADVLNQLTPKLNAAALKSLQAPFRDR